ncbi:hypothetical protein EXIGLDRAFT_745195 [Exidia glandulosa HHB12029]|uniref:Uncharacterized protein n=1 Tax=Exidia glandulosa HHB12029 TaxID=1314781 RepID=A0A165NTG3_EXIGL|nr:hypothetical protein EXIGLDRAFT_745195 [Exidia glandulosa HHB12029]
MRARYFLHFGMEHIKTMARLYPDLYSTQRSFISSQSFNILNRACDSLILLIIAHLEHYPNDPFCPWLYGTAFVEHFFGLARMLLPNFTYAELLAIVKHILLRQRILLSGQYRHRREKTSATGYILAHDPTILSVSDRARLLNYPSRARIDALATIAKREVSSIFKAVLGLIVSKTVTLAPLRAPRARKSRAAVTLESSDSESSDTDEDDDGDRPAESLHTLGQSSAITLAARDAARYAAVLGDYEATRVEADELGILEDDASPDESDAATSTIAVESASISLASPLLDDDGKFSLARALAYRRSHQSETHVHSEEVIRRDPKFNELRQFNDDEAGLVTPNEAAHLLSVAQRLDPDIVKPKTARELRWITEVQKFAKQLPAADLIPHIDSKNITALHPLQEGCFVIMRNEARTYIGEVIEVFKKGESKSGRHGSVDVVTSFTGLSYLALHAHLVVVSSDNAGSEHSDDDSGSDSDSDREPTFSCQVKLKGKKIGLHTHGPAATLLYNLGRKQLVDGKLTSLSLSRWRFFMGKRVRAFTKIMIRGGAQK